MAAEAFQDVISSKHPFWREGAAFVIGVALGAAFGPLGLAMDGLIVLWGANFEPRMRFRSTPIGMLLSGEASCTDLYGTVTMRN